MVPPSRMLDMFVCVCVCCLVLGESRCLLLVLVFLCAGLWGLSVKGLDWEGC